MPHDPSETVCSSPSLAVIIARAGSRGLANKSMQPLLGKPVIAWTLEHAAGCRCIDAVVLSSDCPRILELGRRFGVTVYERPAHRATDTATIDDAARHGVECWETEHDVRCGHVAILYGNVPVRPADLTDRAMRKLIDTGADSVQSVYPVGKMHPWWMRTLGGESGDVLEMYHPNRIYRRQDLPPVYMLDAGVLAVRRSSLFNVDPNEPHAFLGRDRRAIVTGEGDVVDVDTPLDLAIAEAVLRQKRQDASSVPGEPALRATA